MKGFYYGAALAALAATGASAKDERTFAVLRFTNKQLTQGPIDPIVSPGRRATHSHIIMGGSGFSSTATGEDLMNSQCTNAQIVGDNSAYWFPQLYFYDEDSGEFESVNVNYVNVYYFFEATDDEIVAFPPGLKILGGDPNAREMPAFGSATNLDPNKGPIQNVKWTCPRLNNEYNPPSWHEDSDGTTCGVGDPINKGEGVGFPDQNCDGLYSPLRADVHMPSCYDPEKGLEDHKNNMAWPEDNGNGKLNCPEGTIHVPHLFLEVYWDTPDFKDRWTPGQKKQPFVLSSGDATGFSSHFDFMAGWDEDVLQNIIDTCDAGTSGMNNCPGVTVNEEDCTIPAEFDDKVMGTMSTLAGNCPLTGWSYGLKGVVDDVSDNVSDVVDDVVKPDPTTSQAVSSVPAASQGLPEVSHAPTNVVENPYVPEASVEAEEDPVVAPVSSADPVVAEPVAPEPTKTTSSCEKKIHTVWETVTETENVYAEPTGSAKARRDSHGHSHLHGRRRFH
ncbi:uncharacterized protein F5Z01DRAFT_653517 [Emericellopsis atlantica]|uniref:DUF1996 domain-containing protein n=1 Tax=Emericellopsis atlantica TaxID=2614577 RepID=A0A9P7ZMR2_9HYPO|nr:uncharacterized protein F5Z01DRAFT_653517 [Emericellopsis atlantica]KAG9254979.1 hypothetical protein F5Z01DRAFT_653517 [Emericellopsis atlantica]